MKRFVWILLALLMLLCACEQKATQKEPDASERLQQHIAKASEAAAISEEESVSAGKALEQILFEQAKYEIKTVEENVAEITITAPDMDRLLDRMSKKCDTASEGTEFLMEALQEGDYHTVTRTVRVQLDENGQPIENYEFVDAMYGGLLSKFEALTQEVSGDE